MIILFTVSQVRVEDGSSLPVVSEIISLFYRKEINHLSFLNASVSSFSQQGEQLCRFLQLQVLHPVPGLLAALLPVHRCHRAAVLHQFLDSE